MYRKIIVPILCVTLVMGILSGCVEEEPEPTNNAPVAAFSIVEIVNMTATCSDESTDAEEDDLTYSWDFDGDDVEDSTDQNPVYEYTENGTYSVTLTVSDGTDTDEEEQEIVIGNVAPTADFTFDATNLSVNFTDASTDPNDDIVNWTWDFDDGNMSYEQNPTYIFAAAGSYNVTLNVTDMYNLTSDITKEVVVTE